VGGRMRRGCKVRLRNLMEKFLFNISNHFDQKPI
jgi:hypothetical protein